MTQIKTLIAIFLVFIISIGTSVTAEPQSNQSPPLRNTCGANLAQSQKLEPPNENKTLPPEVNIRIIPEKRNVDFFTDNKLTFTICVTNNSNRSLSGYHHVWHSGDDQKMMYLIGPNHDFNNDNKVGMRQIDVPEKEEGEEGRGLYSYRNGLQPGDIVQYTVIADISNFAETGTYDIHAGYGIYVEGKYNPLARDSSRLTVYCSPSCLLRSYFMVVIGLIGVILGLIGVILSSDKARNRMNEIAIQIYKIICNKE